MKLEICKKIIAEWFEEQVFPAAIRREAEPTDLENLSEILAIVGPRRAGKTFLMYQLIHDLWDHSAKKEDVLFVDFDDYRLENFKAEDVETILVAFHQLTGGYPRFIFFDEVQRLPGWSRVLRTLHNQRRYRIVISGSNAELLSREISSELRGRWRDQLLLPFSFREYLRFKNIPYSEKIFLTPARGTILQAFDTYLMEGGFPEVLKKESRAEKRQLLQSYYKTIFYRDILERHNIKAKYILEAVMTYCLNIQGDLCSVSAFEKYLKGHDLPGSKRTISNYIRYLEEAFFILAYEKFSYSPRKRVMNPEKVYLLDNGFSFLATDFSENKGKWLENIVGIELYRRQEEVYYYKNRQECDFIVKRGTKPALAIQVCWEMTPKNLERECRGLVEAKESLKIREGFVLTYGEEREIAFRGHSIPLMPVWKWLLNERRAEG
jgi:hypothetical protein